MSTIAVVAIVVGAVLILLFLGGFVAARRRVSQPEVAERMNLCSETIDALRNECNELISILVASIKTATGKM